MRNKAVYLDNAASSFPKPKSVISAMTSFMKKNGANPGRSGHRLSEEAAEKVYETREKAAEYFGTTPDGIIFTKNATEALNLAIFSAAKRGFRSFLCSDAEHNSVLRPLAAVKAEYGAEIDYFSFSNPDFDGKSPDVVICTAASNVTGNIADTQKVSRFCKEKKCLLITDASQTAGYGVPFFGDIVCTAGHKGLYGPQGTGIVAIKSKRGRNLLLPLLYGGNGTDSLRLSPETVFPESFECGTLNTAAIAGLKKGLDFVSENGEKFLKREKELQRLAYDFLSETDGITVYTDIENSVPLIAFNVDGCSSEYVTEFLAESGICVRGGYHCAPLCHKRLGTIPGGCVRISIGAFNKKQDIYRLIDRIKKLRD